MPYAGHCFTPPNDVWYWDTLGGTGNICFAKPATGVAPYITDFYPGDRYDGLTYNDISDDPPTAEASRFRLYWDNAPLYRSLTGNNDAFNNYMNSGLSQMMFASNVKSDIHTSLNAMHLGSDTRIPIGLMWGWFTLSPKWQGLWDAGKPDLPADFSSRPDKAIVLMTDGRNIRIPAVNGAFSGSRDDDTKTGDLCTAIKAQGITIYTVSYGSAEMNETLIKKCATNEFYYFHAPMEADLNKVFHKIADDILFNTLRLTK